MDTATPVANGAAPAVVERPLDRIRREAEEQLGELLAPLRARRAQLEAELKDLSSEEEEILAVAGALHVKAPKAPAKKSGKSQTHLPSQKVQDDIYAVMAKSGMADMTKDDVRDATGLSESTVMAALRELRLAERIRLTGSRKREGDTRTGGRAPATYAVMTDG